METTRTWKPVTSWKGTHTEDWASWAAFHREIAAQVRGIGQTALASVHEGIAEKYGAREARAAKKRARAEAATAARLRKETGR